MLIKLRNNFNVNCLTLSFFIDIDIYGIMTPGLYFLKIKMEELRQKDVNKITKRVQKDHN